MDCIPRRTLVATNVIVVRDISKAEYIEHLTALDKDSLHFRFGRVMTAESISTYVDAIPIDDHILGAFNTVYDELACAAHVSITDDQAEVGISTALLYRRQGVGESLMVHIMAMCSNRDIHQLYMMCLTDNRAIISLCKKVGLAVVSSQGESQTTLELPKASLHTLGKELNMANMVIADILLKPFKSNWQSWLKNHRH